MALQMNSVCFTKIILHCLKYPCDTVNGAVLARKNSDNKLDFIDSVPLFHSGHGLAPSMEIALLQVFLDI